MDNDSSLREAELASMAEIFLASARAAELAAGHPAALPMRDLRERTLGGTEVGDVSLSRRRYAGAGGAVYLLDDALGLPWGVYGTVKVDTWGC